MANKNKRGQEKKAVQRKTNNSEIIGIIFIIVSFMFLVCLCTPIFSDIGKLVKNLCTGLLGYFAYAAFFVLGTIGFLLLFKAKRILSKKHTVFVIVSCLTFLCILQLITSSKYLSLSIGDYVSAVYAHSSAKTIGGIFFGVFVFAAKSALSTIGAYIFFCMILALFLGLLAMDIIKSRKPLPANKRNYQQKSKPSNGFEKRGVEAAPVRPVFNSGLYIGDIIPKEKRTVTESGSFSQIISGNNNSATDYRNNGADYRNNTDYKNGANNGDFTQPKGRQPEAVKKLSDYFSSLKEESAGDERQRLDAKQLLFGNREQLSQDSTSRFLGKTNLSRETSRDSFSPQMPPKAESSPSINSSDEASFKKAAPKPIPEVVFPPEPDIQPVFYSGEIIDAAEISSEIKKEVQPAKFTPDNGAFIDEDYDFSSETRRAGQFLSGKDEDSHDELFPKANPVKYYNPSEIINCDEVVEKAKTQNIAKKEEKPYIYKNEEQVVPKVQNNQSNQNIQSNYNSRNNQNSQSNQSQNNQSPSSFFSSGYKSAEKKDNSMPKAGRDCFELPNGEYYIEEFETFKPFNEILNTDSDSENKDSEVFELEKDDFYKEETENKSYIDNASFTAKNGQATHLKAENEGERNKTEIENTQSAKNSSFVSPAAEPMFDTAEIEFESEQNVGVNGSYKNALKEDAESVISNLNGSNFNLQKTTKNFEEFKKDDSDFAEYSSKENFSDFKSEGKESFLSEDNTYEITDEFDEDEDESARIYDLDDNDGLTDLDDKETEEDIEKNKQDLESNEQTLESEDSVTEERVYHNQPQTTASKPQNHHSTLLPTKNQPLTPDEQEGKEDYTGYYVKQKPVPSFSDRAALLDKKIDPKNQINIENYLSSNTAEAKPPKPRRKYSRYVPPPVELLASLPASKEDYSEDLHANAAVLEETLKNLKLPAKVIGITRGPAVTRFELEMPPGYTVKKIEGFSQDIAYALASSGGIRIEAPIPGKRAVGVEVPNRVISMVSLREMIESQEFQKSTGNLSLCIGKDIAGKPVVCNLEKMPHLLIAGSTNSGKSACLHSLIISMIYKSSPADVRLILIDPKRVEFPFYSGLRHLMINNIVNEREHAINVFKWVREEMEARYKLLARASARNLQEYNVSAMVKSGEVEKLPNIVIIVDELSDLMIGGYKKEMEEHILSIAQKARASGVHLILATQRPSVDVITGTIKINLPSRIALAVSSAVDSKTILDQGGAEMLLGRGDLLYAPIDASDPKRVQGAYVTKEEVEAIVEFVNENNAEDFDEEAEQKILRSKEDEAEENEESEADDGGYDALLEDVARKVIETNQASTSMMQRRFKLGYARASRIIDQMERLGFIGAMDINRPTKPREVYITREMFKEFFGKDYA